MINFVYHIVFNINLLKKGGHFINTKIINSILIILILFCLISLVGTASAEDISNNQIMNYDDTIDISTESSNLQEVSNSASNDISTEISNADDSADDSSLDDVNGSSSKDKLGANRLFASHTFTGTTFDDLQTFLNSGEIQDGDTVYLGNSTLTSNWQQWDNPEKAIEVNIPNLIISGGTSDNPNAFSTLSASAGIFNIVAPGVTLSNLILLNGKVGNSRVSPTTIDAQGTTFENCIFEGNGGKSGAALYGTTQASGTTFTNCNFTNNRGDWGGDGGGAVYLESSGNIFTDCNFNGNNAGNAIGALRSGSNTLIENCNFTGNSAQSSGAVYLDGGTSTITNCNFNNNQGSNGPGGAVYFNGDELKVSNSIFNGNQGNFAGAIYSSGITNLDNCNFTQNTAGTVFSGADTKMTDCNFDNNLSQNTVTVVTNGVATVDNCNFTNNEGAGIYSASNTDISNSNFINNGAGFYNNVNVCAVYSGGTTRAENSRFEKNNASNTGRGGINSAGDITAINCNFTENLGGAIYGDANAEITNCIIENHEGGNYAVNIYGTATVSNSNFTNNTKTGYSHGGALYVGGDNSQITNSNFEDNHAGSSGAIYTSGANTKIQNCNFTDNSATTDYGVGGAVEVIGQNAQIIDSTFKGNKAPNGGAIMDSASGLTITDCDFEDNTANYGGAVNVYADDAKISGSNFTSNDASSQGGAIYIGADCYNCDMTECNFTDNTATIGTAIYCGEGGNGKVTDCNFGIEPDLSVDNAYPSLILTLARDYSNVVVGDIEGASGGSTVPVVGEPITIEVFDTNGQLVDTFSGVTDANGQVVYDYGDLPRANYTYKAHYLDDKTKEGPITMAEVEGNNFSSIQAAIDSAEPGGVIFLKGITYLNDIQGNMVIDKPITIIGSEGTVLDAEGLSRIFAVNDNVNNVNLDNITFINGRADEGGAIYGGYHTENLVITNCDFINNTANIAGGAIKHHSNWTFVDSAFINNSANPNNDPAYVSDEISYGGGALWCCDGITNLVNTDFIHNNATFGGAIRGAVNARECLVENNTAFNGNGGGIDMTIDSVLFDDVTFMTSVRVENSTFINNSAQGNYQPSEEAKGGKAQGGAIHIYRVDGMNINNITCIDNSAYRGGALDLYVMNYTTIANSTILNNTATLGGGVAVVGNHTRFDNVTMTENDAVVNGSQDGQGGGIWVIGEDCRILNSTIDHNIAEGQGGGAWINGSDVQLNNTVLDSNVAEAEMLAMGGGLFVEGNGCIFNNNTIINNNCTSDAGTGGGICVTGENCIFTNNTVDYNFATYGGGVSVDGVNTNFTYNNMSYNRAETGGGFFVQGENLYVDDLYAFNNTAENGGAAATMMADHIIFKNSTFENNTVVGNISNDRGEGGAIHISASSNVLVQADFINNTACNGSAIYVDNFWGLPSDVKVINSTFFENQAWSYLLNITPENNTYLEENQEFNISVSHQGGDNIINAIYNDEDCETILNNVTYPFMTWDGQLINKTTPTEDIRPVMGAENSDYGNLLYQDDFENNQIINVLVKDKNGNVVVDKNGTTLSFEGLKTDIFGDIFIVQDGEIIRCIPVAGLEPGRYYVEATHPEDRYYKQIYNFTVLRVGPTDLEINKTVSNASCDVNDIVDWNVTTGNIGPIDAENVTVKDILPEGLDLLDLTFKFIDSINGNWCNGKLNISTNTLTYEVYNATAGTWTQAEASYDGSGTWTIVIPDIDGNDDILKPVTIKLSLNKASTTAATLFVSDLLEQSSVVMNLVTKVATEGEFTNIANVTTDTPETNYTNNNASNTTSTSIELINITVVKFWDDENNQDGIRPDNVTIYLLANGVKVNETVLTLEKDWRYTFEDLPVKSNGQVINYTIAELNITGYDSVIENRSANYWVVTNNHTPEVTELNVTKVWDDNNNQDGLRPVSVIVELFADGVKVNETTLSADNNWKFTFPNLPVKKEGKVIVYTINELSIEAYDVVVANETAYDWYVTNNHTPEVTELNVTKVWDDNDDQDGIRPVSVIVELYADGVKVNETTLSADNDWKFTFPNLPVNKDGKVIVYTIVEVPVEGYTVNITNATAYDWTVTNNHTHINIPNMTVQKIANDNLVYVGNTTSFTIVVTNNGECNLSNVIVNDTDYSQGLVYADKYDNSTREWTYDGNSHWTLVGDLEVGQSAEFTVYFNVTLNGTLVNNVTATSNLTNETNSSNNTTAYLPNMTVQKITIDQVVYVGNTTSFKVVVTNTGDCSLSDVVVTDVDYSEGLVYADKYDNSSREWTYDNGKWTLVGDLAVGESADFTVYFNVTKNGTLVNNVTAVSNLTNETNGTNKTRAYLPNMTVQKLIYEDVVYVGEQAIFTIFIKNTGDCDLSNLTVTETWFSDGLVFDDWVSNGDCHWNYDEATRTWTLVDDLTVGRSVSFIVYFNVTKNGTLHNNISAKTNLTNETNATNETKVYLPNMTVQKVTLDEEVYVGDTTRFTIVVENTGDCELDKVYVVDTDYDHSALSYIKYENGSRDWNYDDNGNWTLIGTLAVGEKAYFTVWFEVLTNGTFVNNVTSGSNLTNETNNTNNTTGKPICDLAITKIVNTTDCLVGDLVEWNITVVNRGPSTALDVIVKDVLPEGLQLVDVRGGEFINETHEWIVGELGKDAIASIVLVTKVLINGTIKNPASVNTTIEESNYTNNNASNTTNAKLLCDLVITKVVNCTNCYVSDVVEWNITVVNVGPHNATNVIVKDILPKGMELIDYRVSVGNFNEVISEWSIGTLDKDTPVSLILVTKVLIDGTFINIATVNTTTPESNYTNNKANNTTRADPICDLVISKSVNATKVIKGDYVRWTLKVVNKGPSTALNVKVKDILPKGLKLTSYKASIGKYQNGVWAIGKLAKGASATITFITKTTKAGKITNIASVSTTTHESNYTNNKANNTTNVIEEPACDLVLYKSSDKPKYNLNDTMHWSIKVVNKGPNGAIDAYVKDVLPHATKFVSYTSSKGSFDVTKGVWTIGDLAKGEEAYLDICCKVLSTGSITNEAVVNNKVKDLNTSNNRDNATIIVAEPPMPNPPEPNKPNLSLKTGNPFVVLLLAFISMCGCLGLRCRKE